MRLHLSRDAVHCQRYTTTDDRGGDGNSNGDGRRLGTYHSSVLVAAGQKRRLLLYCFLLEVIIRPVIVIDTALSVCRVRVRVQETHIRRRCSPRELSIGSVDVSSMPLIVVVIIIVLERREHAELLSCWGNCRFFLLLGGNQTKLLLFDRKRAG